jgi:ATP-dependent helicase HepA
VDRYGDHATARHLIIGEPSADGYHTAWLRLLADGFGIFDHSISAVQERTGSIARQAWVKGSTDGVEGILGEVEATKAAMAAEVRRINEIDALEASFEPDSVSVALAEGIAKFDSAARRIESSFRALLVGAEGFRFDTVKKLDGSVTFVKGLERDPLLSPRLLTRLGTTEQSRTGFFDRWSLTPGRRLFRRGNPFIDGVDAVLELDDRGQAGALWRLDLRWPDDPLVYFGFDFIVEADTSPILEILSDAKHATPIALRRADVALSPFMRRVWMPVNTADCVSDPNDLRFLDAPYKTVPGDVNLSPRRVDALYGVMGGRQLFVDVARDCENNARLQLEAVSDMRALCEVAALRVRQQTDKLVAQSRARAQASGLVGDGTALDAEIALGRALEEGVSHPVIRLASVTCLVRSATSWTTYV